MEIVKLRCLDDARFKMSDTEDRVPTSLRI